MSGVAFIQLEPDRLMVRADRVVTIREMGESDLDVRTGELRLGLPRNTVTEIATDREKYYVATEYDVIVVRLMKALAAVGS